MDRRTRLPALAGALVLASVAAGCGVMRSVSAALGRTPPAPAPPPAEPPPLPPATAGEPRVITDLSALSPVNPLEPFGPQRIAPAGPPQKNAALESPDVVRRVGDEQHPGEERLLNEKAARFNTVSLRLMDRLFAAMEELEATDDVARLRTPTDLKSVVITATLNRDGRLVKLALDQHSGLAVVDRIVTRACQQALYMNTPPVAAMTPEGGYRLRIEARVESLPHPDQQRSMFKTYLGIALL